MNEQRRRATGARMRLPGCLAFALIVTIGSPLAHPVRHGVPFEVAKGQCFSRLEGHLPVWSGTSHPRCKVDWSTLEQDDGSRLFQGRYAWPSTETPGLMVVTEVLFDEAAHSTRITPLFATQEDQTYAYLDPLSLHSVSGRRLVEVRSCLNGTGGCSQEFLEYGAGTVTPITNTVREQVQQKLPAHLQVFKSPQIDIDNLTGEGGGWRAHDANCCPSFEVRFKLELLGDRLHVTTLSIQRNVD